MAAFDLPLDQLRAYRPERTEPDDFDAFWAETLAESRTLGWAPRFDDLETIVRNQLDWEYKLLREPTLASNRIVQTG